MTTTAGLPVGQARAKQFISILLHFGELTRGEMISKMGISPGTFAHEFNDYLEAYPDVAHYNKKTRRFSYEP